MATPIPQPNQVPLIGNVRDINPDALVQSLMKLMREYGPIVRLSMPGQKVVLLGSQEFCNEACDERRFSKHVHQILFNIRDFAGDGLFTAHNEEPNWAKAHRVLMPAFGPLGLRKMFDPMVDIADQLLLRWERFGENAVIDVADHMTRLTLDTIALCAFDYRFNSFYQNEMHPFIGAMVDGLAQAGDRSRRPEIMNRVMLGTQRRYNADIKLMHDVADAVIADRKASAHAATNDDLLGRMLNARDPVSGETLSDENIRYQLVTFLIAGHETTSGLLSFAFYFLLKNPEVMQRARGIIDDVLGDRAPRIEDLQKLRYVEQILMETLRIWPTAPVFAVKTPVPTLIGGRYEVFPDDAIFVVSPVLHRDPAVWGDDAEDFRPERFDRDAEARLPPNAWKPFGNGQRACIGRPFAMQEATIVVSSILQRFDLVADDPSYQLTVKETLTLKPQGFKMRAKRRSDRSFVRSTVPSVPQRPLHAAPELATKANGTSTPLLVLFGSNTGSAEAFAQRIGSEAAAHGFSAKVSAMDDAAGKIPRDGAVVVVTASYEGQPPDNARHFVTALDVLEPGAFKGAKFAVFGCGNRQWLRTYQAIPQKVDQALEFLGAVRIHERGEADASGDFFGSFDTWIQGFWPKIEQAFGKENLGSSDAPGLTIEFIERGRQTLLRQDDLKVGRLIESRELVDLTNPRGRSKKHYEIELPEGMSYRAGDYLAVLPRNAPETVERVLRRFGLSADTQIVLHKANGALTTLPTDYPVAVGDLLASYVELGQPITHTQVETLMSSTKCPPDKKALARLAEKTTYEAEVLGKRLSALDLMERFEACELTFAQFLAMLPTLKPRQYSISSSPLVKDRVCSLTVAVVRGPAFSGSGVFSGVASNYLASAAIGTRLTVAVRPSNRHFHPPTNAQIPMILICAGTGIAPFRGFLEERAAQARAGQQVAKSLLFFGCDHPDVDLLYLDELKAWEAAGVVEVRPAFTFATEASSGARFVQDRVWVDRAIVASHFEAGAVIYVCGDGQRMAPAVRNTLARIFEENAGISHEEALHKVEVIERERGRFVEDVFA